MTFRTAALLLLAAAPSVADAPISPETFDAYTAGKTLYYGQSGVTYGVEEYLPDRRVRWSFLDGDCIDGHWYAQGDYICFAYDDRIGPQCWQFFLEEGGLSARTAGDPEGEPLYEVEQSDEPMLCLGPRIGA